MELCYLDSGYSNAVGPTAIPLRFHSPVPSPAMDDCVSVARAVLGNRVSTTAGYVCVGTSGTLLIPAGCARSVESCGNRLSVYVATSGLGMTPGMCGMVKTMTKEERGMLRKNDGDRPRDCTYDGGAKYLPIRINKRRPPSILRRPFTKVNPKG